MKRKLSLLLVAVLSLICLFAVPAYADGDVYTADDVLHYDGLATRVKDDVPGIRSMYSVNKKAVAYLESEGYTVAYGAVMAIGEKDGAVLTDGGVSRTARTLTVAKTATGYKASGASAAAVTVYETGSPAYATGLYLTNNASGATFAYTTTYTKAENRTVAYLEGTQLCYAGFVALTKDGETTYTYDYAEGNEFGNESGKYGVHTSVYEVSEYFLNDYRATDADEKSPFAENATLRRTVATCGIVVGYDDMKKNGSATSIAADATAGTDATYVVNGTGSGNGITFTVPNAKAGMYSVLVRMTNNNKVTSQISLEANGRHYAGRIIAGDTLASANLAVSSTDGYRDCMFHVMLDEGDNAFKLYITNGTSNNAFGVASVKFVLDEEISPKDVVLGYENLASGPSGYSKYETGSGLFSKTYVVFAQNGEFTYNVKIPVGGTYRMVALSTFHANTTVTTTFVDAEGATVGTSSFGTTAQMKHDSSRSLQVVNAFGSFALPAGELTLKVKSTGQIALSNIALIYEEPVEEDAAEKTTTFDFVAKDQTLSSAEILTNGTAFLTRSSTLKMTVKIEQAGVYRLSGKYNTNGGKIHYLTMKSNIDTAHGMESRLMSASTKTSFTDKEEFSVSDLSTSYSDADALGFIYLSTGTHTLTLKMEGSSGINGFGIYNLRLSLETAQTDGSIRILGESYNQDTAVNVKSTTSYASKAVLIEGTTGHLDYSFTPSVTGIYSLYALIADRVGKTDVFTITDALGNEVNKVEFVTPVSKWMKSSGSHYGFGDAGAAVIETHLADGIRLEAGKTYTLSADATTSASRLHIADLRLVLTEREVTYYEKVDVDFASGAIDASTGEAVEKADSFVTEPLLIPKAGTTLRLVTNASKAGALTSANLAVMAYTPAVGGYIIDPSSPLNVVGGGYATGDNTVIGGGYISYYITTTEDNTILRFSCMAKEASQIGLYYVANEETAITVADLGDVDMSTHYVFDESAIGASITDLATAVKITGVTNGTVIGLAYDKGDYLIGTAIAAKTEYAQSVTLDFTSGNYEGTVASLRVLIVENTESYKNLAESALCRNGKITLVPADAFTVDGEYIRNIGGVPNAVIVYPEDMTASANVTTLTDGTKLLPAGSSNYIELTVNAPVAGAYLVDMKHERCDGYIQYLYVKNTTYSAWNATGHGLGRLGDYANPKKSTAETDGDYAAQALNFDGKAEAYVYLLKGENRIRIYMTVNVSGNKLGVGDIRFVPTYESTDDTVVMTISDLGCPSGYTNTVSSGSSLNNNGYFLRSGSTVYFNITVPEDGEYTLAMLGSGGSGEYSFDSVDTTRFFFPARGSYTGDVGGASTAIRPVTLGKLNLTQGTHTVCLTVSSGWLHFNMLLLDKTGEYNNTDTYEIELDTFKIGLDGSFSCGYHVIGCAPVTFDYALTEKLFVTVTDRNGERSYTLTNTRDSYNTKHVFTGDAVTGLVSIKMTYALYYGDTLLYEADEKSFTAEAQTKTYLYTDTHYIGLNEVQYLTKYSLTGTASSEKRYALKNWNYYEGEYDIYGWTADEKLQRVIDNVIEKYKSGEFDIIFFLGDSAMNDGNYHYFESNNVRYKKTNATHFSNPTSTDPMEYFWEHPANISYVLKKKFFDRLAEEGIPYYLANGNHDYVYEYSDDKSDLDFTEWERLYHYAELFGHRSDVANGKYLRDFDTDEYIYYEDSDSANYLVRTVRYNGEFRVLTAMSEAELEAFKAKYAGDGNCYDFYLSEDVLETEPDNVQLLGAYIMSNGFQIDSYDYYTEVGVVNGNYTGQTVRYSYLKDDIMTAMCELSQPFRNTYMVSHMVNGGHIAKYSNLYSNIQGCFYGDVHDEERYEAGGIPFWVAGHHSSAYDLDYYTTTVDFEGNDTAPTPDKQYYYDRGSTKINNVIWGDFTRHPWNFMQLEVHGNYSQASRVHPAFFYENGSQTRLTFDTVTGMDVRYKRAVADSNLYDAYEFYYVKKGDTKLYTLAELDGVTEGYRKVFVGGDVGEVGTSYVYLTRTYEKDKWNLPAYVLDEAGNVYTTAWKHLGNAYTDEAESLVYSHTGEFDAATDEGSVVYYNGETLYLRGVIGAHSGHYLYDEDGDYVYVDANGDYVFYTPQTVREGYVEASIQEQYVLNDSSSFTFYNGPYEKTWFYQNKNDEFVMLDKDGDGILDDGIYTDIRLVTKEDIAKLSNLKSSKYNVDPEVNTSSTVTATIIVKNGKIVKGEGFCHFQYVHTFSYADGSAVDAADIKKDLDVNGNVVYGMYIPNTVYAEEWFGK